MLACTTYTDTSTLNSPLCKARTCPHSEDPQAPIEYTPWWLPVRVCYRIHAMTVTTWGCTIEYTPWCSLTAITTWHISQQEHWATDVCFCCTGVDGPKLLLVLCHWKIKIWIILSSHKLHYLILNPGLSEDFCTHTYSIQNLHSNEQAARIFRLQIHVSVFSHSNFIYIKTWERIPRTDAIDWPQEDMLIFQ